jgi:hypothetical protein
MNKKYIIITSLVLFVVLVAVAVFISGKNQQDSIISQNQEQTDNESAAPSLSPPSLPGMESVEVNSQNLSQSVQENLEKIKMGGKEAVNTKFQSTGSQPLTVEQLRAGSGIVIKPEIYKDLNQEDYSVFSCDGKNSNSAEQGLIMRFNVGETFVQAANSYNKINKNLLSWESSIFSDLSPLLFPGKKISQKPTFKETKYTTENGAAQMDVRYANVKSEDGENFSVDYAVFEENIYIFNSPQCLRKALDKNEPILEP